MGVSGTIKGVKYFKCDLGYAVFVTMDKLIMPSEKVAKVSKFTKHRTGSATDFTNVRKVVTRHSWVPMLSDEAPSPTSDDKKRVNTLPAKIQIPKLIMKPLSTKSHLIGTTVFFTDKHQNSVTGTVRWIGENEVDASEFVGVEAVSYCIIGKVLFVTFMHSIVLSYCKSGLVNHCSSGHSTLGFVG